MIEAMQQQMLELASPAEIIALKLEWEKRNGQRYTTSQEYKAKTSRGGQRYYVRGPSEYADERKSALQAIAENYKKSEEKRLAKRPWQKAKRAKEQEENERWERIYKEKFEDKSYYAR